MRSERGMPTGGCAKATNVIPSGAEEAPPSIPHWIITSGRVLRRPPLSIMGERHANELRRRNA